MDRRQVAGSLFVVPCGAALADIAMGADVLPIWVWIIGLVFGLAMMTPSRWIARMKQWRLTATIRRELTEWGKSLRAIGDAVWEAFSSRTFWSVILIMVFLVYGIPTILRWLAG